MYVYMCIYCTQRYCERMKTISHHSIAISCSSSVRLSQKRASDWFVISLFRFPCLFTLYFLSLFRVFTFHIVNPWVKWYRPCKSFKQYFIFSAYKYYLLEKCWMFVCTNLKFNALHTQGECELSDLRYIVFNFRGSNVAYFARNNEW